MSDNNEELTNEMVQYEPEVESEPVQEDLHLAVDTDTSGGFADANNRRVSFSASNTLHNIEGNGHDDNGEQDQAPAPAVQGINRIPSSDLDPQGILSPETVSVKQRFLYARRMQEMREKERLNRVKLDPKQTIMSARASFYDNGDLQSPASKAFGDRFASGVSTDSLWTETVQKMKQQQQERKNVMKSSTVAYSQQLQQNRVVTQRISQWEELFIQTETTAEELAQIWRIVKEYFHLFSTAESHSPNSLPSNNSNSNLLDLANNTHNTMIDDSAAADAFHGKLGNVDDFTLGGTRVYSADTFGEKFVSYLTESFQSLPPSTKYLGLVSGIFSEKSYKPPLRVITMALKGDSGAYYVAFTIKPLAGHEDDANLLGNRKIVVFKPNPTTFGSSSNLHDEVERLKSGSSDSTEGNANANKRLSSRDYKGEKMFDITFSIVFTPIEREEGDVDVHDCNSLNAFDTLVRSTHHRKSMGGLDDYAIPEEFRSSISAHNSPYVDHDDEEEERGPPEDIEPVDLNIVGAIEEGDEDEEEDEDSPAKESTEVLGDSVATTSAAIETETIEQGLSRSKSARMSMSLPGGYGKGVLSDVINFDDQNLVLTQFSLDEHLVDSITSSSQYLVVKSSDKHIKNILVTSTGRASNVSSQSFAENDQVFEWIRGVAASG